MNKLAIAIVLLLSAAGAQAQGYRTFYNQDISGSPQVVKADVWKDVYGKDTDYVQLTLNVTYDEFDSCQEGIALMTPVRVKDGQNVNDFQLLMGAADGGCLDAVTTMKQDFKLPNLIQIGSNIKISGRTFLVYKDAKNKVAIAELH
jgi:hypothetical protein